MITGSQSALSGGKARALTVDLQDPFFCGRKAYLPILKGPSFIRCLQRVQQQLSSTTTEEATLSTPIDQCQYPEVSMCSQEWYPWQGGAAPNSSPSENNRKYQVEIANPPHDLSSGMDGYGSTGVLVNDPVPEDKNRRQQLGRAISASQSSYLTVYGNSDVTSLPEHGSLHDAGIEGDHSTPQRLHVIEANHDSDFYVDQDHPAGTDSSQSQIKATSQYSGSGLDQTLIPHHTMSSARTPQGIPGQWLHTESSSHGKGREVKKNLELQSSGLAPGSPPDPTVATSSSSSTFMPSAASSSSSTKKDKKRAKMPRKAHYMPPKSHKAASAEKHYVEVRDGQLYHKMDQETDWHLAIRHGQAWFRLLEEANSKSYYRIPQKDGITTGDRTAPVPGHENWGPDRDDRPEELFMLYRTKEVCDRACKPTRLSLGKYRVIDRTGRWMKHWDDVPVTLSSLVPGWYLEALMRRNPDLTIKDLRARFMDSFLYYDHKTKKIITHKAWDTTAVTNRMMRWRDETCNITWGFAKDRTDDRETAVLSLLPPECIDAESTKEFHDLDEDERRGLKNYLKNGGDINNWIKLAKATKRRRSSASQEDAGDEDDGSSITSRPPSPDDILVDHEPGYLMPVEGDEAPSPVNSQQKGMSKIKNSKKRPHMENDDEYTAGSRVKRLRNIGKAMVSEVMPVRSQPVSKTTRNARFGGS